MNQFTYTHRHPTDGNVGIGNISSLYSGVLEDIAAEYLSEIPDLNATTYHSYYTELTGNMKTNFERIQNSEYWQGLRLGAFESPKSFAVILRDMTEMNEIYYSNPKPHFGSGNLYGAAANLIPHRDCVLFCFPGIRVYRVIISTTNGNNDTSTEFLIHGVERRLNKGDYMLFDFDRTLHQVKKTGVTATPRILLKLHFFMFDIKYGTVPGLWLYVDFAYWCYVVYYRIARYTEQIGTDPTTFMGFFFGIPWEYMFYPKIRNLTAVAYLYCVALLPVTHNIAIKYENSGSIVLYSTMDMFAMYLFVVFYFWVSYLYQSGSIKMKYLL
jgi:hypothetical protein